MNIYRLRLLAICSAQSLAQGNLLAIATVLFANQL
jgi:hypothetical protein